MAIKHWPQQERPRERLLTQGAEALSDAELLAIFLRTGVVGKSAVDLARELLHHFGSLRALFSADRKRFCQAHGLGDAKYVHLQASLEMSRRYLKESSQVACALTSTEAAREYIQAQLRDRRREYFMGVFLDQQHRVIADAMLAEGTLNQAAVYPREVLQQCLQHNAAALIVAHNHPSGIAEPSTADLRLTRQLRDALALVDIRLLDHFIVGANDTISLAAHGHL